MFAITQDVDGTALRHAIVTEARRRRMAPFDRFVVPTSWGPGYTKLSKPVPYCADHPTVLLASALVSRLLDPALSGQADGRTWSHELLAWS